MFLRRQITNVSFNVVKFIFKLSITFKILKKSFCFNYIFNKYKVFEKKERQAFKIFNKNFLIQSCKAVYKKYVINCLMINDN